jgi:hypothetical protein
MRKSSFREKTPVTSLRRCEVNKEGRKLTSILATRSISSRNGNPTLPLFTFKTCYVINPAASESLHSTLLAEKWIHRYSKRDFHRYISLPHLPQLPPYRCQWPLRRQVLWAESNPRMFLKTIWHHASCYQVSIPRSSRVICHHLMSRTQGCISNRSARGRGNDSKAN